MTTGRPTIFKITFLVVVLLVIYMPSFSHRCSCCRCSTDSNSHTVVLSKPASYSPALFSIPVKRREHAYQSFCCVRYGESTAVVWLQCISRCCKSTILVQRKYAVSTAHIRLKYGKSTVKYGKNIVLYRNLFLVPTVSPIF